MRQRFEEIARTVNSHEYRERDTVTVSRVYDTVVRPAGQMDISDNRYTEAHEYVYDAWAHNITTGGFAFTNTAIENK